MTDSNDKRVSVRKDAAAGAAPTTVPGGKVDLPRPQNVVAVALAMIISGLAAIAAGIALHGHHDYLLTQIRKNNPPVTATQAADARTKVAAAVTANLKPGTVTAAEITTVGDKAAAVLGDKDVIPSKNISNDDRSDQQKKVRAAVSAQLRNTGTATDGQAASAIGKTVESNLTTLATKQDKDIVDQAGKLPRSILIQGIVLAAALAFIAFGAYAGRYYSRWAVPVIWVLATFLGLPAGLYSLLQLGASAPAGYKTANAISSLALIVAIGFNFTRPTRAWYDAHRPATAPGAPQRRGLFAPRVPPPTGGAAGRINGSAPAKPASPAQDRARTKKRTVAEPVTPEPKATGRPRQASKSRRTEG